MEARTQDGDIADKTIGYQVEAFYVRLTNMQIYTPDYATYYIQQNAQTNDPNLKYKYMIYEDVYKRQVLFSNPEVRQVTAAESSVHRITVR